MNKELIIGICLGAVGSWALLNGHQPEPARSGEQERYRLYVSDHQWDDRSPIVYKLDIVNGDVWLNGKGKDNPEKFSEVETIDDEQNPETQKAAKILKGLVQ